MELLFLWLMLGIVVGIIAGSKGRSFLGWFVYGFLLFPVALVHVLVTPRNQAHDDRRALLSGEVVKCPACAELVRREAVVCKHCGRDLPETR